MVGVVEAIVYGFIGGLISAVLSAMWKRKDRRWLTLYTRGECLWVVYEHEGTVVLREKVLSDGLYCAWNLSEFEQRPSVCPEATVKKGPK